MSYLSKSLLIGIAAVLCLSSFAQDRDYSDCVLKERTKWGEVCEKCEYYKDSYKRSYEETFVLTLKNVCAETVEVKVAMQEKNGKWRTFPVKNIEQGQTFDAFACKGSGKYLYWVRKLDDSEILLPSDQEILSEYQDY